MKIFHTSDWHFGRTLHQADLTPAFEQWADFLVQTVRERNIDAVLISGDVYDRGIPPVAMVDLLSDTLARLTETAHVLFTSGNHDSAKRLGFGSALMRPELIIRTDSLRSDSPVVLPNRDGDIGAIVYPIPYLDPDVERRKLAPHQEASLLERSHQAVLSEALRRIRADILGGHYSIFSTAAPLGKIPRIIMAHAFVAGGKGSESELDIHVGGVDCVPSSIFDLREDTGQAASDSAHARPLIDYVALGHLHGAQQVNKAGQPVMRYSGSPIAFSFSEEDQEKSGVLIEFESASSTPHIELIPAPVYRPLATIRDSFDKLRSAEYSRYRDMFVRAYITDSARPRDLVARLRKVFPYLLQAIHDRPATNAATREIHALTSNPLGTLRDFFVENGGRTLTHEEEHLIEHVWSKHGEHSAELSSARIFAAGQESTSAGSSAAHSLSTNLSSAGSSTLTLQTCRPRNSNDQE